MAIYSKLANMAAKECVKTAENGIGRIGGGRPNGRFKNRGVSGCSQRPGRRREKKYGAHPRFERAVRFFTFARAATRRLIGRLSIQACAWQACQMFSVLSAFVPLRFFSALLRRPGPLCFGARRPRAIFSTGARPGRWRREGYAQDQKSKEQVVPCAGRPATGGR